MTHMNEVKTRFCTVCSHPIPSARLAALPNTRMCIICQSLNESNTQIRRYDEIGLDGETHSTYFTQDDSIEREMKRRNHVIDNSLHTPEDESLGYALNPSPETVSIGALNLPSAILYQQAVNLREQSSKRLETHKALE